MVSDNSRRIKFDLSDYANANPAQCQVLTATFIQLLQGCGFDNYATYTVDWNRTVDDRLYSRYPYLVVRYKSRENHQTEYDTAIVDASGNVIGFYRKLIGVECWLDHSNGNWTGNLHRADGPAVVRADGSREWWVRGQRHRIDGAAVEYADGVCEYWTNGKLNTL